MRVGRRWQWRLSILATAVGLGVYGCEQARAETYEPRLSAVAGASVVCRSLEEWRAYVPAALAGARGVWHRYTITLRGDVCDRLALLRAGRFPRAERWRFELAEAVFVLAHESAHARGIDDERLADCHAARRFRSFAVRLGASPRYAGELALYVLACGGGR